MIIILQLSTTLHNEVSVLEREGGWGRRWRTKGSTAKYASILREGTIFRLLCWGLLHVCGLVDCVCITVFFFPLKYSNSPIHLTSPIH